MLQYNLVHISAGDLLREQVKLGTAAGKKAQDFMDKGMLVRSQRPCCIQQHHSPACVQRRAQRDAARQWSEDKLALRMSPTGARRGGCGDGEEPSRAARRAVKRLASRRLPTQRVASRSY